MNEISISPHFEGIECKGYKVDNVREGGLVGDAGFKSGDIVNRINGMSVKTPDELIQAYKKLKDATDIHVEVERDGKTIALDYQISR